MIKTKYYCDKCEKEITDFNETDEHSTWRSIFFSFPEHNK